MTLSAETPTSIYEVSYFARYRKPDSVGKTAKDLIRLSAGKTDNPLLILGSTALAKVLREEMVKAGYAPPVLAMVEKLPLPVRPSTFSPEQKDSA